MSDDELEFVDWLTRQAREHRDMVLGLGDDMGVVRWSGGRVLISSDMLLDGVHFETGRHSYAQIGRKALACGLSDCAAMAVRPVAATVSVALPRGMSLSDAQAMYGGIFALAEEFEVAVAGGDTTRWDHPLAVDLAIVAAPFDGIEPVTRSGARAGDRLFVTGPLGGSILGHHTAFIPRVREAQTIARALGNRLHAMMDISDGLSLDLWRMCQASGAGAVLDERQLQAVLSDDAQRLAREDGRSALEHALGDGEDYELLLAVEGDAPQADVPLFYVGTVTARGLEMRDAHGVVTPLSPRGFVH